MTAPAVTTGADPIAGHVAALRSQLCGPRGAKADILREVRDGLADAAEGYEAEGAPPQRAAELAVAEFGEPAEIAGGYQVELAARQSRFALAFMAMLGPVLEVSSRILWSNSPAPVDRVVPEWALWLAWLQDTMAWTMSIAAALALVGFGLGARWLAFRVVFVRTVGYALLVKLLFMTVAGYLLTRAFDPGHPEGALGVFEYVFGPVTLVVGGVLLWLAWRCLRVAGRARRLGAR